jgi:hypothetical protein
MKERQRAEPGFEGLQCDWLTADTYRLPVLRITLLRSCQRPTVRSGCVKSRSELDHNVGCVWHALRANSGQLEFVVSTWHPILTR